MLVKPRFFDTPSATRHAMKTALSHSRVVCPVVEVFCRIDPDEEQWFGVIVLDTDSEGTLLHARRCLPDFRVIGALFPEIAGPFPASHGPARERNAGSRAERRKDAGHVSLAVLR